MLGSPDPFYAVKRVIDYIAVYSTFCLKITTAKNEKPYPAGNPCSESFWSNILNENNPEGSFSRGE